MDDFLDMGFFDLVGWLALFVGALVVVFVIAVIWIAISDSQMKKKHRHSASNRPAPQAKGQQSEVAPSAKISKDAGESYGYFSPGIVSKILDALKRLFRMRGGPNSAEEVSNGESAAQWNPSAFTDTTIDRRAEEWDAQEQDVIDVPREILWELRRIRELLVALVNQNERHQNVILDALKRTRNPVEEQPRRSVSQQVNYQKPQYEESKSSYRKEPWLDTLSRWYNSGVENPDGQAQFKQHYQTIRIGVVNAGQRIRDPNIDPQFKEMSAGDYWAVRMDDGQYAVVLRFNLSIETANYGPGAIEWAFECIGYIPGKPYHRVRVNRPAIFRREGENWIVSTPGELDFSLG